MSPSKRTIACFGATGGCIGTMLACALNAGHDCTALARTPSKLRTLLLTTHNISANTLDTHLTVHQGDIKDPSAIAKVLINPQHPSLLVDIIASGVGGFPTFQWSIRNPFPLPDPSICEDAVGAIYTALERLALRASPIVATSTGQKPLLIVVSTAGCGRRRGVPLPVLLQYNYLLGSPLADKQRMEDVVLRDQGDHVRDFVIVRPLVLTDGEARGEKGLRMGWEWGVEGSEERELEKGPEIGYYVSRKDVGTWIFEKAVCEGGWEGKCVYLTY